MKPLLASRGFFVTFSASMQKSAVLKLLISPPDASINLTSAENAALAQWLKVNSLGGLAAKQFETAIPELSAALQSERFLMLAENSVHLKLVKHILKTLNQANIPIVLLKGIALIEGTYHDIAARSMTDIDIWVLPEHLEATLKLITAHDFYQAQEKASRPLALQMLSDGEVRIHSREHPRNLVELHLSPFSGWWLKRTAQIDNDGLWARRQALLIDGAYETNELSAEDSILHLAIHNVINHQFGQQSARALVDTATVAQVRQPDWQIIANRAIIWRVATAVWLHLYFTDHMIGLPNAQPALEQLAPAPWKQRQLKRIISENLILTGEDIRNSQQRYRLLLLLVDRPQDRVKLMLRTVWPEQSWLAARYSATITDGRNLRLHHLRRTIGRGKL